jgi:hypothetical protein
VEGVEERSGGVDVAGVEGVSAFGVPVAVLVLGVVAVVDATEPDAGALLREWVSDRILLTDPSKCVRTHLQAMCQTT